MVAVLGGEGAARLLTFELVFGTGSPGVGCVGVGESLLGFTVRENLVFFFFERQGGLSGPQYLSPSSGLLTPRGPFHHICTPPFTPLSLLPPSTAELFVNKDPVLQRTLRPHQT